MKKLALASALLAANLTWVAPARAAGFEVIAPHRAVYNVELKKASERSGIKTMKGRIVYEVRGNECDGISLKYRFLTNITTGRNQFMSDQHTSTFESADGKSFNFLTKSFVNEQLEKTLKGRAMQTDKGISVVLDSPAAQEFDFPNARFITSYLVKIIELAKRGEHYLRDDLYDGSDDGDATVSTSSFISNPKTVLDGMDGHNGDIAAKLKNVKAWSVSMSYFDKNTGATAEHLPIFETSFLLYENGISSDMVMRYPDYTLAGKLSELEMFENLPCEKDG